MSEQKALTIFDEVDKAEAQNAIKNLIRGKTPVSEVKRRPVGGGAEVNYVNTYYMTRQISLITGFRWSSECLEEKVHPNNDDPKELAAKMRVTIWDRDGNQYSHESWGCVDVKRNVLFFDQWKAAYSDGIKKCLSYFGIANDIYGGKDLQYFGEEPPSGEGVAVVTPRDTTPDARTAFIRYTHDRKLTPSRVLEILGVKSLDEITNWRDGYNKVKQTIEGG